MSEAIQLLSSRESIRRRPQLYVGALSDAQLANMLLCEAFCCARDEARAGNCTRIEVQLDHAAVAVVRDDGPGLPLTRDSDGQMLATRWLLELHACSAAKPPDLASTFCGPGLAVLNALSHRLEVRICVDGNEWSQAFVAGEPTAPMSRIGPADWHGTQISFQLDRTLLGQIEFDFDELVQWVHQFGLGLNWHLLDRRTGRSAVVSPGC